MKRKLPFRNDLPETCFSVLPSSGQFIILPDLVRGVPVMPVTATFAQNGSCTIQLEHGSYVVGEMVNQEYHITARVRVGSAEFVMSECEKAPAPRSEEHTSELQSH